MGIKYLSIMIYMPISAFVKIIICVLLDIRYECRTRSIGQSSGIIGGGER